MTPRGRLDGVPTAAREAIARMLDAEPTACAGEPERSALSRLQADRPPVLRIGR